MGDIDLWYGDDKAGLKKIAEKHPEVIDDLQGIIDGMRVVSASDNHIILESDTHRAVVSKDWFGQKTDNWLLSAYEKKDASGGSIDIGPEPGEGKQNGTAPLQDNPSADKGNEKVPDGQKDSDNSDDVPPETPPDGGGVPVGEPSAAAEVGIPAAESASASAVPRVDPESGMPLRNRGKDRNGNLRLVPNWERATAEQIFTYLSHESRRDTMQGTIEEQVRKARAEVKRVEKSEPKGKKRTERAKAAWERELEKAQAQLHPASD